MKIAELPLVVVGTVLSRMIDLLLVPVAIWDDYQMNKQERENPTEGDSR